MSLIPNPTAIHYGGDSIVKVMHAGIQEWPFVAPPPAPVQGVSADVDWESLDGIMAVNAQAAQLELVLTPPDIDAAISLTGTDPEPGAFAGYAPGTRVRLTVTHDVINGEVIASLWDRTDSLTLPGSALVLIAGASPQSIEFDMGDNGADTFFAFDLDPQGVAAGLRCQSLTLEPV